MQTRILSRILAPMMLLGANVAGAVSLSASGMGQVLIYPYYTVNKGQDTLISVVNASDVGKIAGSRFRRRLQRPRGAQVQSVPLRARRVDGRDQPDR